ncbi:MAG: hypothetical protein LJE93_14970 [Acidobacteria bacterium]|jgi:hypothetical protein|nr:hypothetical protein [Acidobacteriota bacterium]
MKQALSEDAATTLDTVADILLRTFFITIGAMIFTWVVWLVLGDVVHSIHARLFDITRKEFDLFFLYSMTVMKGLNLIFFGFPFVAIKWHLRGRRP